MNFWKTQLLSIHFKRLHHGAPKIQTTMKRFILTAIALAITITAVPQQASAQNLKVGVVDLTRVVSEYYKFKEAMNQLQDDTAKAQKRMNEVMAQGRSLQEELRKLQQEAQDPLNNEQIKQKKLAEFQQKQQEGIAWQRDAKTEEDRTRRGLADSQGRIFRGIRDEVVAAVQEKAARDGYSFVLEKSVLGISPQVQGLTIPLLVYSSGPIDFSDELIVSLNKDAPAVPEAAPAAPAGQ